MGDEHGKRVSLLKNDFAAEAIKILLIREGKVQEDIEFLASVLPSVMGFACISNVFWKDGSFQQPIFDKHIARIALVPREVEKEWTAALAKINGNELQKMYNLGSIILQDRLFDTSGFRPEESNKLLRRLNSVPQDAIETWAHTHQLDNYQAAISIIVIDSLFSNDVFRRSVPKTASNPSSNTLISGEWDTTIFFKGRNVSFILKLDNDGKQVKGELSSPSYNTVFIKQGSCVGNQLNLTLDNDTRITAVLQDNKLVGELILNDLVKYRLQANKRK